MGKTIIKKTNAGFTVFFKRRPAGRKKFVISKFGTHKTLTAAKKEALTIRKLAGIIKKRK